MDAPSTLAKPLFSVRLRWQYALPPSQDFLRVRPSHGAAQSATRLITAHSSCSRDDAIGEGILAAQTRTYIQAETGLRAFAIGRGQLSVESLASILACPPHVWLGGILGSAGCLVLGNGVLAARYAA